MWNNGNFSINNEEFLVKFRLLVNLFFKIDKNEYLEIIGN